MRISKEQNKALCERYPFLIPTNRFSGRKITQGAGFWLSSPESVPEYDYEYTELDAMPDGWRIAFGEQLCEELKQELERTGYMSKYRITQIKEKYGRLCWYSNWWTEGTADILDKYTELSKHTCIRCGNPAKLISCNWIAPWCEECAHDNPQIGVVERFVPIEEYYREEGNVVPQ